MPILRRARTYLSIFLALALFGVLLFSWQNKAKAVAPSVNFTSAPTTVSQYEKFETAFSIGNVGNLGTDFNPYNPNLTALSSDFWNKKGIYVDGIFTKPSGTQVRWPAFWDGATWKLRFSPTETGTWKYSVFVKYGVDSTTTTPKTFECTESSNKGYLEINPNNRLTFRFQNGDTFTPIGMATTAVDNFTMSDVFNSLGANGGNYTRIDQETGTALEYPFTSVNLNNYRMDKAQNMDSYIEMARQNGVYVDFTLESWTKLRPATDNPYIISGMVSNVGYFFSDPEAREVYKRKLRYILARWGYSTNLLSLEFINETGGGDTTVTGYPQSKEWLREMSGFVKGDQTKIPTTWGGGQRTDFTAQGPHLATVSNGSDMLTTKYVPWNEAVMDYVNMHFYLRDYVTWNMVQGDNLEMEPLGSTLDQPWKDASVIADRVARMANRQYKWNKPISITEYSLAIEGIDDWVQGLQRDTSALHVHDAVWEGLFSGVSFAHWKAGYMLGGYGGGSKAGIFKPMANFFSGLNLDNMTTETAYPVSDSTNPSPKIYNPNSQILASAWLSQDKAYLYVKNLTKVWAQILSSTDCLTPEGLPTSCGPMPTAASQTSNIQIKNLNPGNYILEKWSTTDGSSTQILDKKTITVGADRIATIGVSLGTTLGTYDYAYKIYPGGAVTLQSTADKTTVNVGDQIVITNKVQNGRLTTQSGMTFTDYLPYQTELITYDTGGVVSKASISCDKAADYSYPTCTGLFNIPTVTWSNISLNSGETKNFNVTVKALPPVPSYTVNLAVSGGNPQNGETYAVEATTDAPGDIKVEFWVDGTLKATENNGPYSLFGDSGGVLNKNKLGTGTHTIEARVYDQLGTALLAKGSITVVEATPPPTSPTPPTPPPTSPTPPTPPPTSPTPPTPPPASPTPDATAPVVTISSPNNGATIGGRSVTIAASATDNVRVTKMELYISGSLKTTVNAASFTYTWQINKLAHGTYTITVKAYDAAGNIGTKSVTVTK